MEYATAMEEKSNAQDERIIELEASVDGQTVLTKTTDYAASAVSTGTNKKLNEIRVVMKQLHISSNHDDQLYLFKNSIRLNFCFINIHAWSHRLTLLWILNQKSLVLVKF